MLLWLVLPQLWRQKYIAFSLTECLPAVSVGISCRLQAMQEQGKPTSVFCRPDPAAIHLWVTFKGILPVWLRIWRVSQWKSVFVWGLGRLDSHFTVLKNETQWSFFFFFFTAGLTLFVTVWNDWGIAVTSLLSPKRQNWELLNLRVQCNHQCNSLFCTVHIKAPNPAPQKAPEYITTSFCTLGPAQTTAY